MYAASTEYQCKVRVKQVQLAFHWFQFMRYNKLLQVFCPNYYKYYVEKEATPKMRKMKKF
jgi:hypothetical protein